MLLTTPITPYYTQSPPTTAGTATESIFAHAILFTLAFTLLVYLFETYLDLRQRSSYFRTDFPKELEETVRAIDSEDKPTTDKTGSDNGNATTTDDNADDDNKKDKVDKSRPLLPQLQSKFSNAQSYGLDKITFSIVSSFYSLCEECVFLLLGFYPFAWDKAVEYGSKLGYSEESNEIKISLIFLGLTVALGTVTSLPFELYSTFRIEKKHGFNKQTIGLFISDKIKGLILTAVIGGPFVALLLKIIDMGGPHFYMYVWAFVFAFSVFMMSVYPVLIMPMFNKYEALPEGELKERIYALAAKLEFPLTKLFVMDGSKRSSHSNAFMFGFFKNKRIVLFDTLMTQVHDDEILAILGHELGHWKMGHTLTNFVISQLYTGASFYCFSLCYNSHELYRAFGFNDGSRPIPTIIALLLFFQTIWAPIEKMLSYMMTVHSRKCEFEADEFSVNLGMSKKLQSGLCKIHLENLGAMCPDYMYSTYHYSHPPLVERLSAMMKLDKKTK